MFFFVVGFVIDNFFVIKISVALMFLINMLWHNFNWFEKNSEWLKKMWNLLSSKYITESTDYIKNNPISNVKHKKKINQADDEL